MSVEANEIENGAKHGQAHDDDPHGLNHVALDVAISEETVSYGIVVVKVPPYDGRPKMYDQTADIDHDNAEEHACETVFFLVLSQRTRRREVLFSGVRTNWRLRRFGATVASEISVALTSLDVVDGWWLIATYDLRLRTKGQPRLKSHVVLDP